MPISVNLETLEEVKRDRKSQHFSVSIQSHIHIHTHMPQATRHTLNVPSPMPLSGDGVRFRVRWRAEFKPPMMGKMQLPGT